MTEVQKRGQLTEKVQKRAEELLDRKITRTELRMMPYTQYVMMNEQRYNRANVNEDDKAVMQLWEREGHIKRNAFFSLEVTKEFWDIINEILWIAYVDIEK